MTITREQILANRRRVLGEDGMQTEQEQRAAVDATPARGDIPEDFPGGEVRSARASEFQTKVADAKTLVKSFNEAQEAGDLEEMVRLFNGKEFGDAIAMLTAKGAHAFVEGHWRDEIKKANGERQVFQYNKDVHDTVFFLLKMALSRIVKLEFEVQHRAAIATARLKRQNLRYVGTYKHGEVYTPGNFATHDGSVWACTSKTTDPPPGDSWVLAVRKGRDLR